MVGDAGEGFYGRSALHFMIVAANHLFFTADVGVGQEGEEALGQGDLVTG